MKLKSEYKGVKIEIEFNEARLLWRVFVTKNDSNFDFASSYKTVEECLIWAKEYIDAKQKEGSNPDVINLNDEVTVALTDWGLRVYNTFRYKNNMQMTNCRKVNMALWELMKIFGPEIRMGFTIPFEDNNIIRQ